MSKMVRHAEYELTGDGDSKTTVRIKKWSVAKFFLVFKTLGAVLEEALKGAGSISEVELVSKVISTLIDSEQEAIKIIQLSVESPELTPEAIGEWYPEDFLAVLNAIAELNVTEDFLKNFRRLFATVMAQKDAVKEGGKKSEPTEQ
ncbi:MAG: hypothetical protein JSW58_08360 [Candidatus Latescibacterota bacterium]|nr:MAG: hypothetical protein JSW58_08360 [Candidatus Latescibacterota bacterium]